MIVVIALWVVAMLAGLLWARWAVAVLSLAVVIAASLVVPSSAGDALRWLLPVLLGASPWLLAAQRHRFLRRIKRTQSSEAVQVSRLQQTSQSLGNVQDVNHQIESHIGQITDLYHVTKETARAMRVEDLFAYALEIVPRLLTLQGLRLIDLAPDGTPRVLRAAREKDGKLRPSEPLPIQPLETQILQEANQANGVAVTAVPESGEGAQVVWAPLRSEEQSIGILMADGLPEAQRNTYSVIANQLALQLARIHFYQAIESMAVTDSLTGMFVRRYFLELSEEELRRSTHHKLPCTFLMVDLDLFKSKNDTYGHLVGDVVLREVAQLMHENLREVDLMARYGGEEFIILLIETDAEHAMVIAERLRQAVETKPIRAYDETLSQTISIGMAIFSEDGGTLQELIDRADQALYAAKRAGRNRVIRWTSALKGHDAGEPRGHHAKVS